MGSECVERPDVVLLKLQSGAVEVMVLSMSMLMSLLLSFFLFIVLVLVVVDDIMFSGPPTVRFLIPVLSFVFSLFPLFNSFSVVFLASGILCTNCLYECVDSRVRVTPFLFLFSFRSYFFFLTSYFSTLHCTARS